MPPVNSASPLEALGARLGATAGRIEREVNLRVGAAIADMQRRDADRELRFVRLEQAVAERLASLKDGAPGRDGVDGASGATGERGEAGAVGETGPIGPAGPAGADGQPGPQGERGEAGAPGEPGPQGERGETGIAGARGEPGPAGERGADGLQGAQGPAGQDGVAGERGESGERGPQGERGEIGPQGMLPEIRTWADEIQYRGDVVTHCGSLYQAARDTAKEPPHSDWVCLATAGRDGSDGRSFTIRGTFNASGDYDALDVVTLNGASFAAKRDNPGICPGDGWQLIAMQGGRGKPGERGMQGPQAARGTKVDALSIDGNGLLVLRHEDGSTVECDLYPLLSRIG